jgi:hypothetical protein
MKSIILSQTILYYREIDYSWKDHPFVIECDMSIFGQFILEILENSKNPAKKVPNPEVFAKDYIEFCEKTKENCIIDGFDETMFEKYTYMVYLGYEILKMYNEIDCFQPTNEILQKLGWKDTN